MAEGWVCGVRKDNVWCGCVLVKYLHYMKSILYYECVRNTAERMQ